jgi:hypothetical protein
MTTTKKITWKSMILILNCYKSKYPLEESKKQVLKQGSFQRLCLSDISNSSSTQAIEDLSISFGGSNKLHAFTLEELKEATHNFSWSNMLGEGGFGPVYKGFVDEKLRHGLKAQTVAVKCLDLDGLQGHREWLVSFLNHSFSLLSVCLNWRWIRQNQISRTVILLKLQLIGSAKITVAHYDFANFIA